MLPYIVTDLNMINECNNMKTNLKHIVITEKNFEILKKFGQGGDSLNDCLDHVFRKLAMKQLAISTSKAYEK